MKFRKAVKSTAEIKDAWQSGLQAMPRSDREHVKIEDTQMLRGSVDIDGALRQSHANEPRWDYAIGYQPRNMKGEVVYWVEIHPASGSDVDAVLAKAQWLKEWLRRCAPILEALPKALVWVSSGETDFRFTARSRQARRLAQAGVRQVGRRLVLTRQWPPAY